MTILASQSNALHSRRDFFAHMGYGFVGSAIASLLGSDLISPRRAGAARKAMHDLRLRPPHFEPQAKSVIQFFMSGGPSQMDLLDPKPALDKHAGERPRAFLDNVESVGASGGLLPSPFKFSRHGQSGLEFSNAIPHIATCADDIAVIRSMWTTHFNHSPAVFMMHGGRPGTKTPTTGSWVVYGLGSENQNLPAYVALDDPIHSTIVGGSRNWHSGWLPPIYQGTRLRSVGSPLLNLEAEQEYPSPVLQLARDLHHRMADDHRHKRPQQAQLAARIASYELAARMQISATDALDISTETKTIHEMYGLNDPVTSPYGRRCLMARRLVERGVRFVQIFVNTHENPNPWDHHGDIEKGLRAQCGQTDLPVAGLIKDLKQRGMLDSTLLIWGGEFGRLPMSQGGGKPGRDHGANGFSVWLAGGGTQGGTTHGATDDFGYHAVQDRVSVHDLHATILHLMGLDHERLVYNHHGLDERLTGVDPAHVVKQVIA